MKQFIVRLAQIFKWKRTVVIRIGDYVTWEVNEVCAWESPRRVVHIDSFNSEQFAWVDGSMTGIPIKQLKKEHSTMRV